MNATKSPSRLLLVSLLLGSLLLLNLFKPIVSTAGPQFGITPTDTVPPGTITPPPTPTTPNGGTPSPTPTRDTPPTSPPETHVIDLELGCNLVCTTSGLSLTVQANIRLIHQGSGWIAEATISNQTSTQVTVPYGGQWEVWLVSLPEVSPPDAFDAGTLSFPTDLPVLLGIVSADSGLQLVNCPVGCIQPTLPLLEEEVPPLLPQTGWGLATEWIAPIAILSLIITLVVVGLISANRSGRYPFLKGRFRSK